MWLRVTLCVSCAHGLFPTAALAEPLRVLLRLSDAADHGLLRRVRGQTDDLDVRLEAIEREPLEASLGEQLASARQLATQREARVVGWVERERAGLRVVVVDLALDRVLIRELSQGGAPVERSAQEEAAALVVRSALRASIAGDALGAPAQELLAEPTPPAPVPAPLAAAAPPPPPLVRDAAPRALYPELELALLSGIDGVSQHGHHTLTVRAALRVAQVELALLAGVGLPSPVTHARAALSLAGHRLEASAGWSRPITAALRVSLVGAASLHLYRIEAEARDARLAARDGREALLGLSGYARLVFVPSAWRRAAISLRLGGDAFPQPLTLGYHDDSGFVRVRKQWAVQPQLGLGVLAF
jgi:hypothetical protein